MIRHILRFSTQNCRPQGITASHASKRSFGTTGVPPIQVPSDGKRASLALDHEKLRRLCASLQSALETNAGVIVASEAPLISKEGCSVIIESQQCGADQFCSIASEEGLHLKVFRPDSSLIAIPLHNDDAEEAVRRIVTVLKRTTDRIGERF